MAESTLAVTAGSGTNLRTNTRTIAAQTVHEQAMLAAEGNAATYTAIGRSLALAATSHLLFIQGDGTNYCRIRRISIRQATVGTATNADIRLYRTTTAGSGGTTVSARPFDSADTNPYAGTAQTIPSSAGTIGDQLLQFRLPMSSTAPSLGWVEWTWAGGNTKPIIFGTSTASGIVIRNESLIATNTVDVEIEFVVTSYI